MNLVMDFEHCAWLFLGGFIAGFVLVFLDGAVSAFERWINAPSMPAQGVSISVNGQI